MRDILARFPTCQEGIDWVGGSNAEEIYSLFEKPGWFLFVLMNTQNFKNAAGFPLAMKGLHNCMSLIDGFLPVDQQTENAVEAAYRMSQGNEPYADLSSESSRALQCFHGVYEEIKKSGVTTELSNRMYYYKIASHFIDTAMSHGKPSRSSKSAHQAGDGIVLACLASIHPGILSPVFNHDSVIDTNAVESDRSRVSILACDLIRKAVPYLFSKYD